MSVCVRCGKPIRSGPGSCACVREAARERAKRERERRMAKLRADDPETAAGVDFIMDTDFGGQ